MFSKSGIIYSFFRRPKLTHHLMSLHKVEDLSQLSKNIQAIILHTIRFFLNNFYLSSKFRETKRLKDRRDSNRAMNYNSHYNTVIFVDCEGLTPQSDAGLTDKAPPSSAACCRNRTPADGLQTQQQTCPIDFLHFLAPNMSQHGQQHSILLLSYSERQLSPMSPLRSLCGTL